MTTDEDIIQAASEAYAEALRDGTLSARAGEWDREIAAAVVAAVRPLIEAQTLNDAAAAWDAPDFDWAALNAIDGRDVGAGTPEATDLRERAEATE